MARELWSAGAGILFGIGWWILIDGMVSGKQPKEQVQIPFSYYIPAIGATLALIMLNLVSLDSLNEDSFGDNNVASKVRIWLFLGFAFSFGCIAGGITIMADKFPDEVSGWSWTGIAILLQPILVFISALILLFARKSTDDMNYSTV